VSREAAVAVCVVTHDSAEDVAACVAAVAALAHRPLELVVVDCASGDGTVAAVEAAAAPLQAAGIAVTVVALATNAGFAGGMNRALKRTDAPWVLTLNPDALPEPDFVDRLLARAESHPELRVGAVTGRLVRLPVAGESEPRLDACGMRLTRSWRHLDRGSGERDRGQWGEADRVFGATGAASLFRREALDDAAVDGEVFDSRFHTFREDAELAFRLRERGWEVLYEPAARAVHRRWNLPERRRRMPPWVNYHSLKNRYLLRLYHQSRGNFWRTLLTAGARDLAAFAYALLLERSSLPAYTWLWRHRRELLFRRYQIRSRQTVAPADLQRWFGRAGEPL
jgi:GT2 family glycosyltransferase